jgi:hypothetical protein
MAGVMNQQERLVHRLISKVPEFESSLREHLEFNEELLPHVLFGDLTRWVIDLYRKSKTADRNAGDAKEVLARVFDLLEERFADPNDTAAHDLIGASFLENLHQAGPDYQRIKDSLGPNLKAGLAQSE